MMMISLMLKSRHIELTQVHTGSKWKVLYVIPEPKSFYSLLSQYKTWCEICWGFWGKFFLHDERAAQEEKPFHFTLLLLHVLTLGPVTAIL